MDIHEVRKAGLKALPKIAEEVKRVRSGSQHILVAYVNAADGCIDLPTSLSKCDPYQRYSSSSSSGTEWESV